MQGKGDRFLPAGECADVKKRKFIYRMLTMPHVQLDLIVEGIAVVNGVSIFFVADTKLTI